MQTYYTIKNKENMYLRKYIRTFTAKDLSNAEIFRTRDAAVKAHSALKHEGVIVKIEVNLIE